MEASRSRKVLTSYFLFVAREQTSAQWHSLLVMEYRDSLALERRDQVMAEVRKELASNANWKSFSDSKQSIRKERSLTRAAWELLPSRR